MLCKEDCPAQNADEHAKTRQLTPQMLLKVKSVPSQSMKPKMRQANPQKIPEFEFVQLLPRKSRTQSCLAKRPKMRQALPPNAIALLKLRGAAAPLLCKKFVPRQPRKMLFGS
jgi:hypothetical protein